MPASTEVTSGGLAAATETPLAIMQCAEMCLHDLTDSTGNLPSLACTGLTIDRGPDLHDLKATVIMHIDLSKVAAA